MVNKEKIETLKAEIAALKKKSEPLDEAVFAENEALLKIENKAAAKKKGNVLLIISALLVVAEIFLVLFYSPFEFIDLLIIGAFLVPGISKKISGMREWREGEALLAEKSVEDRIAERDRLEAESEKISSQCAAKKSELKALCVYKGEQWKIAPTNMHALATAKMINPRDSAALDKLAADFRQVIELLAEEIDEDFAETNWFTLANLEYSGAISPKGDIDRGIIDKYNDAFEIINAEPRYEFLLMWCIMLTVMKGVWDAGYTTLEEAMRNANVPVLPECYQELFQKAKIAVRVIGRAVRRKLR